MLFRLTIGLLLLGCLIVSGGRSLWSAPPESKKDASDALPDGALARLAAARYGNVGRVFSVAFSPDGKTLASGSWDGSIRLWEVATGKELRQFAGHKGWVKSVAFSPGGKMLVSGGRDRDIHVWEVAPSVNGT